MKDGRARRVTLAAVVRAADGPESPSYSCTFELTAALDSTRPAEQWLRAVLEEAPRWLRMFVVSGWKIGLRLRLGPARSSGHILGWRIVSVTPTEVVIAVTGPMLSAYQTLQLRDAAVVHTTLVHYDRPAARVLWALAEPIHVRVIPYLLEHAARIRTG